MRSCACIRPCKWDPLIAHSWCGHLAAVGVCKGASQTWQLLEAAGGAAFWCSTEDSGQLKARIASCWTCMRAPKLCRRLLFERKQRLGQLVQKFKC